MPASLYMDVHVPQAVTHQLRRRGVDVLPAFEDNAELLDDEPLLDPSSQLRRVLVTQDVRFYARAVSWKADGKPFAGLAYAHQLSITIGEFVRDLELIAKASLDGECENEIFRLPF
jgi:hypothetical protein